MVNQYIKIFDFIISKNEYTFIFFNRERKDKTMFKKKIFYVSQNLLPFCLTKIRLKVKDQKNNYTKNNK